MILAIALFGVLVISAVHFSTFSTFLGIQSNVICQFSFVTVAPLPARAVSSILTIVFGLCSLINGQTTI